MLGSARIFGCVFLDTGDVDWKSSSTNIAPYFFSCFFPPNTGLSFLGTKALGFFSGEGFSILIHIIWNTKTIPKSWCIIVHVEAIWLPYILLIESIFASNMNTNDIRVNCLFFKLTNLNFNILFHYAEILL
jgi:hypothetical protein